LEALPRPCASSSRQAQRNTFPRNIAIVGALLMVAALVL
jgi:hypothetical protein